MSNLVIVAIPAADDDVWKVSSEKVPHMTFLFLGEAMSNPNVTKISESVKKASESLSPFNLRVDHRGVLGTDEADVLFFAEEVPWQVIDFRQILLGDINIKSAYNSLPQHNDWAPHLTLGYPKTPANSDNWDPKTAQYVQFDKVAVWFDDFAGIEVPLFENSNNNIGADSPAMAWSDRVAEFIKHHGVKGMRWGVRGARATSAVTVSQKGKKLKAVGGSGHKPSSDAVGAKKLSQVRKKSGVAALSNEQLQSYQRRLQLEQSVKSLEANQPGVKNWIGRLLKTNGNQQVNSAASTAAAKGAKTAFKKAGLAVA